MKKIRELFQKKYAARAVIIFASLIVLFVLFNDFLMPWYVGQREETPVPPVIGKTFDEASTALKAAGLDPHAGDTLNDPKYPFGTVINQNPEENKSVRKGRRVYLTLSGGEKKVPTPNLRGRTLRDAKFQLEHLGLKLGRVEYQGSDEYPENTIVAQSVNPKASVKRGSYVGVVVSQGRVSEKIAAPDLIGKSLKEAESLLESIGLKIGNKTFQSIPDVLPNSVVDQFPRVGEMVQIGGTVDVFVSQEGQSPDNIEEH